MCAGSIDAATDEFFAGDCNACGDVRLHKECAIKHGEQTIIKQKSNTSAVKRLRVGVGSGSEQGEQGVRPGSFKCTLSFPPFHSCFRPT